MNNPALAIVPAEKPIEVTADQLALVRNTVAKGATPEQLQLYLYDCQRQGVHPLDKLLHFTLRSGKYTPVTSIDLMRMRAQETGEYVGNDSYVFTGTPGRPGFTALAQVWRLVQGQRVPFSRMARWEEYVPAAPGDHMWRKMPHVMLGKCAEAQALRAGFPRQLHGLYAAEEMDQAEAPAAKPAGPRLVTKTQQAHLFKAARAHGWTDEQLKTYFAECGWDSSAEIPADQYDELLQALEKGRTVEEGEAGG
jgi:phage recombination protein Bet